MKNAKDIVNYHFNNRDDDFTNQIEKYITSLLVISKIMAGNEYDENYVAEQLIYNTFGVELENISKLSEHEEQTLATIENVMALEQAKTAFINEHPLGTPPESRIKVPQPN